MAAFRRTGAHARTAGQGRTAPKNPGAHHLARSPLRDQNPDRRAAHRTQGRAARRSPRHRVPPARRRHPRGQHAAGQPGPRGPAGPRRRARRARNSPFSSPSRSMLASPEATAGDIWARHEELHAAAESRRARPPTARGRGATRRNARKASSGSRINSTASARSCTATPDGRVEIYSRDLRRVTGQFEEIAKAAADGAEGYGHLRRRDRRLRKRQAAHVFRPAKAARAARAGSLHEGKRAHRPARFRPAAPQRPAPSSPNRWPGAAACSTALALPSPIGPPGGRGAAPRKHRRDRSGVRRSAGATATRGSSSRTRPASTRRGGAGWRGSS